MIDRMVRFNLGERGSSLLDYIIENPWIFVIVIFIYGSILLYSKRNYKVFMPTKMKEIVQAYPGKSFQFLFDKWQEYKKQLPWYILVPTENELWVIPLKNSKGHYKLMLADDEYFKTEQEMMNHQIKLEQNRKK